MSTDEGHSRCLTRSPEDDAYYHARWIGKPISEALRSAKSFSVRGTTSRGIFLELDTGWIAFLTSESYRGPLTLNLDENIKNIEVLAPGVQGDIINGCILFGSLKITIDSRKAQEWSSFEQIDINNIYNLMAIRNSTVEIFIDHLAEVLQTPNEYLDFIRAIRSRPLHSPKNQLEASLLELIKSLQAHDAAILMNPLKFIAGRGRGLTPSGDDFLAGLLLGLYLCDNDQHQMDLGIRQTILDTIRSRSTLISANLAVCAAGGEVDERIAKAVEYLLLGHGYEEGSMQAILDWGSSSGVDTIAGFLTAIHLVETDSPAI